MWLIIWLYGAYRGEQYDSGWIKNLELCVDVPVIWDIGGSVINYKHY